MSERRGPTEFRDEGVTSCYEKSTRSTRVRPDPRWVWRRGISCSSFGTTISTPRLKNPNVLYVPHPGTVVSGSEVSHIVCRTTGSIFEQCLHLDGGTRGSSHYGSPWHLSLDGVSWVLTSQWSYIVSDPLHVRFLRLGTLEDVPDLSRFGTPSRRTPEPSGSGWEYIDLPPCTSDSTNKGSES